MIRIALVLALALNVSAELLLINAGGPEIPSIGWRKDTAKYRNRPSFQYESPKEVAASGVWKPVYKSHAYSTTGDLSYTIPLNEGTYDIYLLFSEVYHSTAQARQFTIFVNDRLVHRALDVFQQAGGAFKPFYVPVRGVLTKNGSITVRLARVEGKDNPMLSGLVIDGTSVTGKVGTEGLSATATINPPHPASSDVLLRRVPTIDLICKTGRTENTFGMNIGGTGLWSGDFGGENKDYIDGSPGVAVESEGIGAVPGGYRYAYEQDLTYRIPVPHGTYTVTTYHAEQYFNAPGKRVFNIFHQRTCRQEENGRFFCWRWRKR